MTDKNPTKKTTTSPHEPSTQAKTRKIEELISEAFRTNTSPAMSNIKRMCLKMIMPEFDKWVADEIKKGEAQVDSPEPPEVIH